jgi:hypothetical protein
LKPWQKKEYCIGKKEDGEFVAAMEDVLSLYERPYNEKEPLICMDEQSEQLLSESREPIPMNKDHPKLEDYEYKREGTCSIFMFTEPLTGRCFVNARGRRTRADWAYEVQALIKQYPKAEKIILVSDNLNTHSIGSLYETLSAEEAFRIARKVEMHHTPKHGSWLNIAEIELSALTSQCLGRRIGTLDKMNEELTAWQRAKNRNRKPVNWQFTTVDARIKLRHLYPVV